MSATLILPVERHRWCGPADWLSMLPDHDVAECFELRVVRDPRVDSAGKLAAAAQFEVRWGRRALLVALDRAARADARPIDRRLRALADRMAERLLGSVP